FVPLFRMTGSVFILSMGAAFILLGLFVGRPYCRFLCPYGALLKVASLASKWRVRVTPDYCTQCKLCENSCPFGAMREPSLGAIEPKLVVPERRRLGWLLLLTLTLIAAGAGLGSKLGVPASKLHPTVQIAERYARQQKNPVQYGVMTPEALSLERSERDPEVLLKSAAEIRNRFALACMIFGGWV